MGFDIGDWPTRQIALAGKRARFLRFTDKIAEQGAVLIRKLQNLGHNVTQFVDLYDFSNFNTIEHLCFQCLPIYIYIAQTSEKNYPLLTNKTIMTNGMYWVSYSNWNGVIVIFYGRGNKFCNFFY